MRVSMEIQGVDEFRSFLKDVEKEMGKGTVELVREASRVGVKLLKESASGPPSRTKIGVRSNRLRGGIQGRQRGSPKERIISTNVPYALIHEFGGPIRRGGRVVGQMPQRPWIRPALKKWEPIARKILRGEVRKRVTKSGLAFAVRTGTAKRELFKHGPDVEAAAAALVASLGGGSGAE